MRITFKRSLGAALVLSAVIGFAPRVRGADDDDQKKKDKDWKKLEEKQKKGGEKPGTDEKGPEGHGDDMGLGDNPLSKILDLMKEVETRLNDTDPSEYTQEDEKKIVEAMKFEGKTKTALDDLIKKLEDMQNQSQSSGGESSEQQKQQQQQQQQQQQKNETPEQRRERERQEREKQQREKRAEQQRQRMNPQQQKKPQDQQKTKNDQKKKSGAKAPEDSRSPLNPKDGDANRWGDLPSKLHSDAEKARSDKPPERWREQIEQYRAVTSEGQ